MKKKRLKKSILLFVLGIFLIGFISAFESGTCNVVQRTSCGGSKDHIVMGLTNLTNAHGQNSTSTGNYDYVLCCTTDTDQIDYSVCIGDKNKIIGLSSTTNAHAEIPFNSNYIVPVCYEDFHCEGLSSLCPADYKEILSLTSNENAHIGKPGDYPIKICCSSSLFNEGCSISKVEWNVNPLTVEEGTIVPITVTGSNLECIGQNVSFVVKGTYESLPENTTINEVTFNASGIATTSPKGWTARWEAGPLGRDPTYKVTAYLKSDNTISQESNLLTVTQSNPDLCLNINTCEDYEIKANCETDSPCNVSYSEGTSLGFTCSTSGCKCLWNTITNKCGFVTIPINSSLGYCSWNYTGEDEGQCAETGTRTITKDGTWIGQIPSAGTSDYATYLECIKEYSPQRVPCLAQTKLPFFDKYTLIVSLIVITVVYLFLSNKKKLKKNNKKELTKKKK